MTVPHASVAVLVVLGATLACVLAALAGALVVHRVVHASRGARARARAEPARRRLAAWATGAGPAGAGPAGAGAAAPGRLDEVVAALRALPPTAALRLVVDVADGRLSPGAAAELGAALRNEPWAARVRRGVTARRWWRRLEATHLLAVVGTPADAAALRRLLADPHVAVRAAASRCLRLVHDAGLVAEVVAALPAQPPALRALQAGVLREHAAAAEPALVAAVAAAAPGDHDAEHRVAAWAALAATLRRPKAVAALLPFADAATAECRAAVVRALGACPSAAGLRAIDARLADADALVRAAAAQAAGHAGPVAVRLVPALAARLGDPAPEPRLHAALALAQLGEPGRAALRAARAHELSAAREVALLVAGLPDGALLELAAA